MSHRPTILRFAAAAVLAVALVGCPEVAEQGPAGGPAVDPVDPTGGWIQDREPFFDSCDLGRRTEHVRWELIGSLLSTTGPGCDRATYRLVDNRVTDVRTLEEAMDQPGCILTATVRTELVFTTDATYVGSVDIVGDFSGTCEGACRTVFDIAADRCAVAAACSPVCD